MVYNSLYGIGVQYDVLYSTKVHVELYDLYSTSTIMMEYLTIMYVLINLTNNRFSRLYNYGGNHVYTLGME